MASFETTHPLGPGQGGFAAMYRQHSIQHRPLQRPEPAQQRAAAPETFSWYEGPVLDLHNVPGTAGQAASTDQHSSTAKEQATHRENIDTISPSPPSTYSPPATAAAAAKNSIAARAWKGFLATTKGYDSDGESIDTIEKQPEAPPKPPNAYQRFKRYMQADTGPPPNYARDAAPDLAVEEGQLEPVRTISKVPGNPNYYEKNGLRTEGDGEDHHEPQMNWKRFMVLVAMAFLWSGSQIPLYLFGGIIALIEQDIGGADRYVWIALGNLIPLAVVTPFVGSLSDLFGRRTLALWSTVILMVGVIVCSTAKNMNIFIAGQVLNGVAAGILELTALAVAGEISPTKKRGLYVGGIVCTILPYCPSVLYAQLVTTKGSWRWIGLWIGAWAFVGFLLTFIFYWPPDRANRTGLSRREMARRIDYVGALLSAGGLTLFLAGLTWGGNSYPWTAKHTLVPLVLGAILCIAFVVWEIWFVPYPMFPGRLKQNPRALYVIVVVTFVSGANFFAVLIFWPTQYYYMYADGSAVSAGLGSLPVGFGVIVGAILVSFLIWALKGNIRIVMVLACCVMTAGNGAMASAHVGDALIFLPVCLACLGVGAVIIPNQIIASIVCPDDLIGSVTALTISVRVIGGAIAYAVYYNILRQKFTLNAINIIGPAVIKAGVLNELEFYHIVLAIAGNLDNTLGSFPALDTPAKVASVIAASRVAWQESFPDVYYVSIAFGGIAIIASCFLPNLSKFMDGHVAVQYH